MIRNYDHSCLTFQERWKIHFGDKNIMTDLTRGTQIIYVPMHAGGDTNHPDCEIGFVTSSHPQYETVFCRYWSKHTPGELRTKANSECTPIESLVIRDTVPQARVEAALKQYC